MEFDYYVYIVYSENLIGYCIIEKEKIKELPPKITKLHHYKEVRHKRKYISAIKKRFIRDRIKDFLLRWKIREFRVNIVVLTDVIEFIKKHKENKIFISIDNTLHRFFMKLLVILGDRDNLAIVKESKLKKGTMEYQLSLMIDNLLNIERNKSKGDRQSY